MGSKPMAPKFRSNGQIVDVRLVQDQPEGAETRDRYLRRAEHVDEADLRALQLPFVPFARRRTIEGRFLDRQHRIEIVRPCKPLDLSHSTQRSPPSESTFRPESAFGRRLSRSISASG